MGVIGHVINKVFGGGGSSGSYSPGAAPAPAVADATQQTVENTNVLKKKRGKASLMINTSDTSTAGNTGTGLNI